MKKTCPECELSLDIAKFAFKNKAKGTRQPYCDECRRARAKDSYRKHKKRIVRAVMDRQKLARDKYYEYKKTQKCHLCSESEPVCLVFHHLDPSIKEFEVSTFRGHSWKKLEKEIKKCVCLCANCHAKIHAGIMSL